MLVLQVSQLTAVLLSSLFAAGFVGSFYTWALFGYDIHQRNNETVIKQRFISTFVWSLCIPVLLAFFAINPALPMDDPAQPSLISVLTSPDYWEILGIPTVKPMIIDDGRNTGNHNNTIIDDFGQWFYTSLIGLLLTMILFIGPLIEADLSFKRLSQDYESMPKLQLLRALVVGPLAEEWVYRACVCSVLLQGQSTDLFAMLCSPLLFGLSHAHHIHYQVTVVYGIQHWKRALTVVCFQLFYTTIFGCIAAFVFVRVKNVLSPILMHTFCNFMGFPPCTWAKFRCARDWINFSFYVLGLISFIFLMGPLTDPDHFHAHLNINEYFTNSKRSL